MYGNKWVRNGMGWDVCVCMCGIIIYLEPGFQDFSFAMDKVYLNSDISS
jgi:hypothetical protein